MRPQGPLGHPIREVGQARALGDIISFGQNSSRIFARWPGVFEQFDPIIHKSGEVNFFDWNGKYVTTQSWG